MFPKKRRRRRLSVGFGFREAHDFGAILPLSALFEEFNALETLQDVAFCGDSTGAFEAAMLRHT